jgi:3'-phosphoadenosine 5'-phosphosulfate sulfotransferase (PAPS reductase)/FAD synthetase
MEDDSTFEARLDSFAQNCTFTEGFQKSMSVLCDAIRLYSIPALAVSFSGGKEACVVLYLLRYCILKTGGSIKDLKILYFQDNHAFPEVDSFLTDIRRDLNLSFTSFSCSYKQGMEEAVGLGVKGVFMGVRVGDPYTDRVEHFQPSSPSWPAFMRINPVTHWSYGEVWEFLRVCKLPYCVLYDQGYTSLGNRENTVRNSLLRVPGIAGAEEAYLPAYMLGAHHEHLERTNRSPARRSDSKDQEQTVPATGSATTTPAAATTTIADGAATAIAVAGSVADDTRPVALVDSHDISLKLTNGDRGSSAVAIHMLCDSISASYELVVALQKVRHINGMYACVCVCICIYISTC